MGGPRRKKGVRAQRRYFAEWWKGQGGEDAKARRRQNYALSAGLRKKARARATKSRERRAEARAIREARGEGPKKRGPCRPRVVVVGERTVTLVTSGVLRARTGLARRTLLVWEERKIIPCGWIVDELDRRWYPEEYVAFMERVAEIREDQLEQGGTARFLAEFKPIVTALWFKVRRQMPNLQGLKFQGGKRG